MANERIGLLVAYGPEARAFLQSGLAERLGRRREVAILTPRATSAAFQDLDLPVLQPPAGVECPALRTIRAWSRGARNRLPALAGASTAVERCAGKAFGDREWSRFLRQERIGAIVAASASGARVLPALQAAANTGVAAVVLLNSWRDTSVRPDFPAAVSALGLVAAEDRSLAGYGAPQETRVVGSLHQAAVRRAPEMSRRDFCAALGLDPERPIVLYATAANDDGEPVRVRELANRFQRLDRAPQLLVRTNPMDRVEGGFADAARAAGFALQRPVWEWAPDQEWNCPLPADLPWWRAALEHAELSVSLPSTVALDFAAWAKPAVNLAFGRGTSLWLADGYDVVKRNAWVYPAESFDAAAAWVERLLGTGASTNPIPPDAAETAAQLIEATLRAAHEPQRSRWSAGEVIP